MKTPTYQEFLNDPSAVLEEVNRAARRERADALHRLVFAPLMRRLGRALPKQAQILQTRTA